MKLAQKSALMYEAVQRKYKVFRLFNKLHVSNSFYENQFAKLLELAKRLAEQTDYTENNTDYHCQIW